MRGTKGDEAIQHTFVKDKGEGERITVLDRHAASRLATTPRAGRSLDNNTRLACTLHPHKSLLEKPGSILNEIINIPKNLSSEGK